jgi:hypothetical protein
MLQFPAGTHRWIMDDIHDMLEAHPEYENMSDEDLNKKKNDLYWEAQGCFDRGNRLESDGDTIERYIDIRKKIAERK